MRLKYRLTGGAKTALSDAFGAQLFIYAVGYEARSSFFRSNSEFDNSRCLALDYQSIGLGSYDANKSQAIERADDLLQVSRKELETELRAHIGQMAVTDAPVAVAVDVTCLDRTVMAVVLSTVLKSLRPQDRIQFLYAPAAFTPPKITMSPLKSFQPAIPEFGAPVGSPYETRMLIMGLGYEYGAALNVLNTLEPHSTHLFAPIGFDDRYLSAVKEANFNFEFDIAEWSLHYYDLADPVRLHGVLRDLIYSNAGVASVSIVPFGPKLLSAICIILAVNNPKDITLLRYSVDHKGDVQDVRASGEHTGFTLTLV